MPWQWPPEPCPAPRRYRRCSDRHRRRCKPAGKRPTKPAGCGAAWNGGRRPSFRLSQASDRAAPPRLLLTVLRAKVRSLGFDPAALAGARKP